MWSSVVLFYKFYITQQMIIQQQPRLRKANEIILLFLFDLACFAGTSKME